MTDGCRCGVIRYEITPFPLLLYTCTARIAGANGWRRAGTLDDTSWLVPVAHFFRRCAQPWLPPAPDAGCFETQPNGWRSLLPAWRSRWADSAD
jgi:hypothetical protein